jgi:hypothetical protein
MARRPSTTLCLLAILVFAYLVCMAVPGVFGQSSTPVASGTPSRPAFLVARSIPVSGKPAAVAAVDLNGDGQMDMVVANTQSGTVDVFLAAGRGKFGPARKFAAGPSPVAILAADFNGDGKPDVAVANGGNNSVSILLGNGDGTLQAAVTYNLPGLPVFLAAGNVGGKGQQDLLVAVSGGKSVFLLANKGNGSFQAPRPIALGAEPRSIAIGDFTGKGKLDFATANSDGSLTVVLGDGKGGFIVATSYAVGVSLSSLAAADLNRDGHIDLAVADSAKNSVIILLGNGDGSFRQSSTIAVGHGPVSLAVTDLNGDGISDLAVANRSDNTVSILLGIGDGGFHSSRDFVVGNAPSMLVTADFNGDGRPGLATANFGDGTISMPLVNSDGTLQAARSYRSSLDLQFDALQSSGSSSHARPSLAAGDLDGDGHSDLVISNFCGANSNCAGDGSATVFLSDGKGGFRQGSTFVLAKGTTAIALADVNGDRQLDLLAVNPNDNSLTVMFGNGDGTFQPAVSYPAGKSPVSLIVVDLNKDGKADIVILNRCASTGCNQPGEVSVLLGNGDGSFQTVGTYTVGFKPSAVAVGDLNGDGNIDVAVANSCGKNQACTNGTASLLLGDGSGKFTAGTEINLGRLPSSIAIGTLRSKGAPDLIAAYQADDQVGVLLGNGDGTFQRQVLYAVGAAPSSVVIGDFSGSGRMDVGVANLSSSTVSILAGNGDGTLQNAMHLPVGSGPGAIISADLSVPGRADIVSTNGDGSASGNSAAAASQITVLQNQGANNTTLATTTKVSASPACPSSSPCVYGTSVTFTATVADVNKSPVTQGTVDFLDSNDKSTSPITLCSQVALDGNGTATCTADATTKTLRLVAAIHHITANYSGFIDDPGGTNFSASSGQTDNMQVSQKTLTVTPTVGSKVYDGSTTATVTFDDRRLNGDIFSVSGTAAFPDKNVGAGRLVSVSGISISGTDSGNYVLASTIASTTADITARPLTVTAASDTKTYDGTLTSTGTPTITSGSLASLDIANFTQAFGSKNAGPRELIASGAVNDGNSGNNYAVTFVNANGTIHQRPITVTAASDTKTYDRTTGSAATPTITSGSLASPDTANFTQSFDSRNAGPRTLTASGAVQDGNGGDNYAVTFMTATGSISKRAITVTAAGDTKTYDGTLTSTGTPTITSGSLASLDTADFIQLFDSKLLGSRTLTASGAVQDGNGGNNYAVTFMTATGTIGKRPITVTAAADTKTYDGTTGSTATPTVTNGSLASLDTASFTQSFDNRNAGSRTLTASGTVQDGNGGNNYAVTFMTTTGTINKRPITVTAASDTKTYDGTTGSTGTPTITSGNLVSQDTATFAQLFDSRNAGPRTLSASTTVSDGNGGNNYAITFTTAAGAINKRPITVTAVSDTKTYDGLTSSTKTPTITSGNLISPDTATFAQLFDSKNAGNRTLTPSASLSDGNNGQNYAVTPMTASGTINQFALIVTAHGINKVYDGKPTATVTLSDNRVNGDIFTDSFTAASFPDKIAGSARTVSVSGISISGTDAPNYTFNATATTTANISQFPLNITATGVNKVYDGTAAATVTLSDNRVNGDVFADSFTAAAFSDRNVGSSKSVSVTGVSISGTDAGNYTSNSTATTTATIMRAPLSVTADSQAKPFDGAPFTAFTAKLSGFVPSETDAGLRGLGELSGNAGFDGPAIEAINFGKYMITPKLGGLAAKNYSFNTFADGTLTIGQAGSRSSVTAGETPINDAANGATFTFSVIVTPQFSGTPTGSVTFSDSLTSTPVGTVSLGNSPCPSGAPTNAVCASLTTTPGQLPPGAHIVTATYNGDSNFITSSSKNDITTVAAIQTNPGQVINPVQIQFNDIGTSDTFAMQCSVQSAAIPSNTLSFPKCAISANSLTLPGSLMVTISTSAGGASAALTGAPARLNFGLSAIGMFAVVLMAGFNRRKRSRRSILGILGITLLLSAFLLLVGCGGGGFNNPGKLNPPVGGSTPSGAYVVSVTGTDSASGKTAVVATIPLKVGI